ncbi:MAG: 50S ribosomal protein L24 [Candidatus Bathyarchaeia archaeon]
MKVKDSSRKRKHVYSAHTTARYKMFGAPLSKELREKYGFRTIPIVKGDQVIVSRGDNAGVEGNVIRVDRKRYRIHLQGLNRKKVDGTEVPVAIHPSKVVVTKLNLKDKWREKVINRKLSSTVIQS